MPAPTRSSNPFQNSVIAPDQHVYMKGWFAPRELESPRTALPTIFQRVIELSVPKKYDAVLLLEYLAPREGEQYRRRRDRLPRNLMASVLAAVYSQEGLEVFEYLRDACRELCGLVTGGAVDNLGYANYSEWSALRI